MSAKKKAVKKKTTKKPSKLVRSNFDISGFTTNRWQTEREFLESVGISKNDLSQANIAWQELAAIYLDHESSMESLQQLANTVSQMLQQNVYVNSTRTRVKAQDSLVRKVVRKRIGKARNITLENYKLEISDLVGVRVLHVLKNEWLPIHTSIIGTFKMHENSKPVAYITRNDESLWKPLYVENGCKCETNETDYKSVHYDINIGFTKETTRLEIQVRTINEEAWGELDHKINYPTPAAKVVGDFIRAANMLSSTADHLSQHIIHVNSELSKMETAQKELKSERDAALKEIRGLVSKLAKTKEDKEHVEKALSDLETRMSPKVITGFQNNQVIFSDSKPLSLNLNSPSILNTRIDSAVYDLTPYITTKSLWFTCKYCDEPVEATSATRVCTECISKGLI